MKYFRYVKIFSITIFIILFNILGILLFSSCKDNIDNEKIKVYITETKEIKTVKLSDYICGVVAAEINPNSHIEALKTQAVLARTFTLDFINNNKSKYENADISDDITEAQAYNPNLINDNIRKAVKQTSGIVIKYNNELIKAWFHANSGGKTALYNEVFGLENNTYPYLKSVETFSQESLTKWNVTISKNEILNTLRTMGQLVSNISTFNKGEIGDSGRVITFIIGGKEISANTFRLNLGSTKLKSTLIDEIIVNDNDVTFSGYGYGHGVGVDQDYCVYLANQGNNFKQIIEYFYNDIEFDIYNNI